ncbi:lariocidin family lasso peptide [Bacillus swezeyi]
MRKLNNAKVKNYGAFLAVTLSKKSKPGDGKFGRGVKRG